jgi:hypothetical protein
VISVRRRPRIRDAGSGRRGRKARAGARGPCPDVPEPRTERRFDHPAPAGFGVRRTTRPVATAQVRRGGRAAVGKASQHGAHDNPGRSPPPTILIVRSRPPSTAPFPSRTTTRRFPRSRRSARPPGLRRRVTREPRHAAPDGPSERCRASPPGGLSGRNRPWRPMRAYTRPSRPSTSFITTVVTCARPWTVSHHAGGGTCSVW